MSENNEVKEIVQEMVKGKFIQEIDEISTERLKKIRHQMKKIEGKMKELELKDIGLETQIRRIMFSKEFLQEIKYYLEKSGKK
jgi:phage-related protein